MAKLRKIKWRHLPSENGWMGKVLKDGVLHEEFYIDGLCSLTRLHNVDRVETDGFRSPDHYVILSVDHAKDIAHDLLNGLMIEYHEENRRTYQSMHEGTAGLINETKKFLESLKETEILEWTRKNFKDYGEEPVETIEQKIKSTSIKWANENFPAYGAPGVLSEIYEEGVKSEIAKEYWYEQFKKSQK